MPPTDGRSLAPHPTPNVTVACDWRQINYSDSNSVDDPINGLLQHGLLGASKGPGFGWRDVSAHRRGAAFKLDRQLTFGLSVATNTQPVPTSQTLFNILVPGVVQTHLTCGASGSVRGADAITGGIVYAPRKTVYGSSGSIPTGFGGSEANVSLEETSIGIGWSRHFGGGAAR